MIFKACIKKVALVCAFGLISASGIAQITQGKIVYERKTNLKKLFKDNPRVKGMGVDLDTRIERFELYFDEHSSAYLPIETGEDVGMAKFLTSHNKMYKDRDKGEKLAVMEMMGREMYVRDTMTVREWKITDRKRTLAGYECRRAVWEMNDTTRIYAWFSVDVVPSIGPEGFDGLPGAILGLATEDGTIIYFAKEVKEMTPPKEVMIADTKGEKVYSQQELKELLIERMGKWVKPEDLEAMFSWL